MEYGELMKDIRFENDVKQKDMAEILGLAKSTYNQYEQQYDIIPLKYLIGFCNYFDVSIDYMFGFSKNRQYDDIRKELDLRIVGQRLRKTRREFKYKQIDLASKINIANSSLSLYEKGKHLISTATLYSLCKIYNVSADYLLNRTDIKYLKKDAIEIIVQ